MGFEIREPADFGMKAIAAVHDANYLAFLETAHREWKRMPEDWGDEGMSNVYVYENMTRSRKSALQPMDSSAWGWQLAH